MNEEPLETVVRTTKYSNQSTSSGLPCAAIIQMPNGKFTHTALPNNPNSPTVSFRNQVDAERLLAVNLRNAYGEAAWEGEKLGFPAAN